jgi:chromate transporter
MAVAAEQGRPSEPVTLPALFTGFLQASLSSFGSGIIWVRRVVVERRGWASEQEFADILSLCQFMPGPNAASVTVCVGQKLRGPAGAFAALSGFIVVPWTIGFALGALYLHYTQIAVLQNILRGVAAAAAGLIIATGIKLLLPHRRRPAAVLFAALGFAGLAFAKLPLLVVVVALAPLSIAVAAFEAGRRP